MATKTQIEKAVATHLDEALAAGKAELARGDIALSVQYNQRDRRLRIELASGSAVLIPVGSIQGLANTSAAVVKSVEITGRGTGLYWPSLDLDVSVPGLVAGCFGNRDWMSAWASRAGRSTSKAKVAAARENGKKGGRPRKTVAPAIAAT